MTETMQGKAVPWPEKGLIQPGEYAKHPNGTWYCRTPNGRYGNLANHTVQEHEDGSITVTPSILIALPAQDGLPARELWHGHLERGVWRSC